MANYNGSLDAVDCDMLNVRYDMVLERSACSASDGLFRSPNMLWRRRYGQREPESRKRCFYTIMANYNGSLDAVDCDMLNVIYYMAVNRDAGCGLRWPHQGTQHVVPTPIWSKRA